MKHITLAELEKWKKQGKEFKLIDVREPEEHESFNIGGVLIPFEDVTEHIKQFENEIPTVIYCKRGIRSQLIIQKIGRKIDTSSCYNLKDGIIKLMR